MGSYEGTAKRMAGKWKQRMQGSRGLNIISIHCMDIFRATTATYLFWKQRKHSASVCECVLFAKVCERQGEATRVQGFKRFRRALPWPVRHDVLFCDRSSGTQGHAWGLEPIPAVSGRRLGCSPDRSPVYRTATSKDKQLFTLVQICSQFRATRLHTVFCVNIYGLNG